MNLGLIDRRNVGGTLGGGIGFDMVEAGPLASARLLEPLAMLWISLAYRPDLGPNISFGLLRRWGTAAIWQG